MGVNIEKPDIYQLFSGAQVITHVVNVVMKPSLNSFDVEEENGLFLVEYLRKPRILLIVYHKRYSYQKVVSSNRHYCTQSMIIIIKHMCV